MILTQLKTLVLSDVIDYYIRGNQLHVILEPKGVGMVNRLVKFDFDNEQLAGDAIELLHEMVANT